MNWFLNMQATVVGIFFKRLDEKLALGPEGAIDTILGDARSFDDFIYRTIAVTIFTEKLDSDLQGFL